MSGTAQCPACGSADVSFLPGVESRFTPADGPGVYVLDAKVHKYRCARCGREFAVTVPHDAPGPGPPVSGTGGDRGACPAPADGGPRRRAAPDVPRIPLPHRPGDDHRGAQGLRVVLPEVRQPTD